MLQHLYVQFVSPSSFFLYLARKEFPIGTPLYLVNASILCAVFRAVGANNNGKKITSIFLLSQNSCTNSSTHLFF